jgi:hypothetical protein
MTRLLDCFGETEKKSEPASEIVTSVVPAQKIV